MPCTFVGLVGDATRACRAGGAQHATLGGWRAKLCDPGASPQLCAGSVCRSVGSVAGCTGHHLGSASGTLQLEPAAQLCPTLVLL